MCYTKEYSLAAFGFGILTSIMLIYYGNEKYAQTNKALGYSFMFISCMQLIEWLIWNDVGCVGVGKFGFGLNKLGSLLGPIFNHTQPLIILGFALGYIGKPDTISYNTIDFFVIPYSAYLGYKFAQYISESNMCTSTNSSNHLDWAWKHFFNYGAYHIMILFIVFIYRHDINIVIFGIVSYILLLVSIYNFDANIGEFWCLMVTGIPLVNLFCQKVGYI